RLADGLGLIPRIPDSVYTAAKKDHMTFGMELMKYAQSEPNAMKNMPFILAKTLGKEMGSAHLATLWGLVQTAPKGFRENAARAGFSKGMSQGEEVFQAILDHPEGLWVGRCDPEENFAAVRNEDHRINIWAPEMADWVKGIDADSEARALEPDSDYPLLLMAGRHMDMNANTLMRDPSWNKDRRACTLAMNPEDAEKLNIVEGQMVKISTEAGEAEIEVEVTEATRFGQVIIPHGFGMEYMGEVYGVNVNRLTKNTYRDPFAGTPLHRCVPCRIKPM
ncbi:MAG: molybdopterin dinucleotide binding domain-containing protein, partial [Desulfatiglandales bacterium]